MARIDRIAQWIAADLLRAWHREEEFVRVDVADAELAALKPIAYILASGVVKALDELISEMAPELAEATAVIRVPVHAGVRVDPADLAEWEAEFCSDDPPEGD